MFRPLFLALAAALLPCAATAAVLPVQGALKMTGNTAAPDGNYVMVAALYDKADAPKPVWQELEKQVAIAGGLFALDLGGSDAIPDALLASGQQLWVGLQVGGDAELPRTPLRFVPKAYFAQAAATGLFGYASSKTPGGAADDALHATNADNAKIADSAKTADKATTADFATASNTAKIADVAKSAELAEGLACSQCVAPGMLAPAVNILFLSAKGGTVAGNVVINGDLQVDGGLTVGKDAAVKGALSGNGIASGAGITSVGDIVAGGGVKVGAVSANCDDKLGGMLRWTGKHLQVCDGKDWRQLDNAPTPQIVSIAPLVVTQSGGQTLTINGVNFADGVSVQVGGVKAAAVKVLSATQLEVTVPPQNAPGNKDVTVIGIDGGQNTLVAGLAVELDGLAMWFDAARKDSWPGQGTTWLDVSGNAAHAKMIGGLVFNTLGGAPAMDFNGTGAGAQFPNAKLNSQKFMGVYWVWSQVPQADNNTGGLYVNRDVNTANAGDWVWFGKYGADTQYFRVNNGSCCIDIGGSGGGSWVANVPNGKWKMVHFGYEVGVANSWKWGVDGKNVATGTVGSHPNSQSAAVSTIGYGHEGSGSYWKGGIAAARFYTRALSDAELQAEYLRTKGQYGL